MRISDWSSDVCSSDLTLPLAGLAVYPAAGGRGVAEGSVLQYLLERDGVAQWLTQRRPLDHFCYGRDYDGDIDPVLAGAGARLVSSEPARAAAALINAGKLVAPYAGGMETRSEKGRVGNRGGGKGRM